MFMGHGRPFHSTVLHVILIALAIQGVTPDAYDLASLNALRLFCPLLGLPTKLTDDDELPDEICGPAEAVTHSSILGRGRADKRSWPAHPANEDRVPATRSYRVQPTTHTDQIVQFGDLVSILCRLDC
jgi:hypothetical protein